MFCFLDCLCFDGILGYNYRGVHVVAVHLLILINTDHESSAN